MFIKYDYARYRNKENLRITSRLVEKNYPKLSLEDIASVVCAATYMPIFISYRMINEFADLSIQDWDYIKELESYYGAYVSDSREEVYE
jgi:hypothetical protein